MNLIWRSSWRDHDAIITVRSSETVDCILLDLVMPGMTGEEACRRIKTTSISKDIPVLILTAHKDQEAVLSCLKAGADDYIPKAAEFDVLKGRIRAQLRRKQYEGENRLIQEVIETMRKSEARFRSAFEHTNVAMVLMRIDNQIIRVNNAFAALFGYSADEMIGLSMIDLTHPEDAIENQLRREGLLAGRSNHFQMEMRYLQKNGHSFWSLTNISLVRSSDGMPLKYVGQVQDTTERKHAEEANRRYNERLKILHQIDRALIAGEVPEAIAAGVLPHLRDLLDVRHASVSLFDLELGEAEWLAGTGPNRVRRGPGVRFSLRFMGDVNALKRGEFQLIDVQTLPPGPDFDALVGSGIDKYIVVPMIVDGELIGAFGFEGTSAPLQLEKIGIAQEVATQFAITIAQARMKEHVRDRTSELVNANRELRQKNQENEMFVYSVSHDLRSPLVNLQGFSKELSMVAAEISATISDESVPQLIREKANSLVQVEMRESIRFIQSAVMRLSNTIDALLHLSRVGRIEYQCREVDMHELIRNLVDSMSVTAHEKEVVIQVHELAPCQGDATAFEQLFSNLLGNALKYLDPQRPGSVEVGEIPGDPQYRTYFVRDNGLGIRKAYQEKIFLAFKRFHADAATGEGMGLAIVRRIAERHGGEVSVESEEGVGSTFFVKLPNRSATCPVASQIDRSREGDLNANRTDGHRVGGR